MADERLAAGIYALLALIIMLPLLGEGYYLALDMQFGPNSFAEFHFEDLYGYGPNPYGAYLPVKMVLAAFSQIIPVELLEKALLFAVLFLCGFLMHVSLPKELGNSRYFAGLLYMLNPFVFVRFLAGHWMLLLSYALWPFAIRLFLDFIKKPEDNNAFAKAALITMAASISSHGVMLLLIAYLVVFIMYFRKDFRILAKRTLLLAAVVLAMNLFWILPTLLMFDDIYSPASAESYMEDFGPSGGELPVSLAVITMHGFWRTGFTHTKDVFDLWHIPYLIIAALSALGFFVLLKKNRKCAISLLVIFIIGLLLSLGSYNPMAWIFNIFEQVPVYFIFRDSQKFVGLICLVYSVLGAYGVHYMSEKTSGMKKNALLIALLAVPIIYNFGFFGFLGQVGPTAFPEEWTEADRIIAEDNVSGRILILPMHLYKTFPWANGNQKTLGNPESHFFSKSDLVGGSIETENVPSDMQGPATEYVKYMFDNRQFIDNTAEMLLPLNARYILLSKEDEDSIHYLYLFYRIGGVENIEMVYEGDSLYLFRNNLVKGPFFTPEDNKSEVEYEELTPAFYKISGSEHEEIVFAKSYNRFLSFSGEPVYEWNGIANGFAFSGRGMLENRMFNYTLMFLLLWLLVFVEMIILAKKEIVLFVIVLFLIYLIMIEGMMGPAALGWIIILAITAAIFLRVTKKETK